jgi:uncharacterized protein YciW
MGACPSQAELEIHSMDEKTRQKLIDQETSAFLDPAFGQLDTSGFPSLDKPVIERFETEDRHGFSNVDTRGLPGTNRLKDMIQTPDKETLVQLAENDPTIAEQLAEQQTGDVAEEFVRQNEHYLRTDYNRETIIKRMLKRHLSQDFRIYDRDPDRATLALYHAGHWTVENLTAIYKQLLKEGELEVAGNEPRCLSAREKTRVEQIASSGDVLTAIIEYVKARIGPNAADEIAFSFTDAQNFVADPKNRPYLEEGVYFCRPLARPGFSPSRERWKFMKNYCAGRFPTVALLDAAWAACQVAEKDATRSALFGG